MFLQNRSFHVYVTLKNDVPSLLFTGYYDKNYDKYCEKYCNKYYHMP